jgi:hypothetical protein
VNLKREQFERDAVIEAYKRDVDRTLIRENLRLTVEQRFDALMKLQQFAEELRRAGSSAKRPCARRDDRKTSKPSPS